MIFCYKHKTYLQKTHSSGEKNYFWLLFGTSETFMMVALSSRSAWSISALSLTLIFKLSLNKDPGLRFEKVKVKMVVKVNGLRKVKVKPGWRWKPNQSKQGGRERHSPLFVYRHVHPATIYIDFKIFWCFQNF